MNRDQMDLMELVEADKKHIINFLLAFNLKVKDNSIQMLFSEDLENPRYKELWKLKVEPSVVKVEFTINNTLKNQKQLHKTLQILIDKIVIRGFPSNTENKYEYTTPIPKHCQHYQSINFENKNGKTTLVGATCYCS